MMQKLIQSYEEYKQAERRIDELFSKPVLQGGDLSEISKITTLMAHYEQEEMLYDTNI